MKCLDGIFKNSNGKTIKVVENFINKIENLNIEEVIRDDIGKIGFVVSRNNGKKIFLGAKKYMHNPSSISLSAYKRCLEDGMDFGIVYLYKKKDKPFEDYIPKVYIFDINEVKNDTSTSLNKRFFGKKVSHMVNFRMKLGKLTKFILFEVEKTKNCQKHLDMA